MGKKQIVIRPEEQKPSHEVFSKKTINGKHLLKDEFYEREFRKLEIELVKFQNWVKKTNQKSGCLIKNCSRTNSHKVIR